MRQINAARITLSATAATMLSLIALQSILPVQKADAHMVSKTGGYTAMTVSGGGGSSELVFIIDDRNEDLLVYENDQARAVDLVARESLPALFQAARAQSLGQRP